MKKLFLWVIIGVCAIEIGLAVYHIPIANFSLLLIITVAGLVGLALLKLLAALLRDRTDERKAWLKVAEMQHQPGYQGL